VQLEGEDDPTSCLCGLKHEEVVFQDDVQQETAMNRLGFGVMVVMLADARDASTLGRD